MAKQELWNPRKKALTATQTFEAIMNMRKG
jgi:hypothetical protein